MADFVAAEVVVVIMLIQVVVGGKTGHRLTIEQFSTMKMTWRLHQCGYVGHWTDEQNLNGSLKPGAICSDATLTSHSESGSNHYSSDYATKIMIKLTNKVTVTEVIVTTTRKMMEKYEKPKVEMGSRLLYSL